MSLHKQNIDESMGWRERRYGKILGRDVEAHIFTFREISERAKALKAQLADSEKPEFWTELVKEPNWAAHYQVSFEIVMARFMLMTKSSEIISELAKQKFPTDTAKIKLEEYFSNKEAPDSPQFLPLFFAINGNIEAITQFSCTMNDLLLRAQNENFLYFLAKAASIDTAILSLPAAQVFMKFLQFSGETETLLEFFRFIGRGPHKTRQLYQELRWAEYLLREQGAFEACTQDEIFDLLVNGLKIYGDDGEHKDAKKALFMLFRKWRKEAGN